jgi:hypothetical protein
VTGDLRTVATPVHGRYLVARPDGDPAGLLVGFHGYAEDAETHLTALQAIAGVDRWLVVAVQALHPFYTRDQRIVANWMTSQDRELAIADNTSSTCDVLSTRSSPIKAFGSRSSSSDSRKAGRWRTGQRRIDMPTG